MREHYNIFFQKVGRKEGVSIIPGNIFRHQGARRQMAGLSEKICMSQVFNVILSNFVKGKNETPKDFPEGCRISHKVVEQIS